MSSVKPDSLHSFVILGGAFIANFLCSLYSVTGIFNVIFLEVFDTDKSTTALLGALHSSLISGLIGPVASVLINRFGLRCSFAVGATISMFGFFFTFFASSLINVFITYGIIAGSGLGIIYTTAASAPNFYFVKYRNLVNGISLAGCGIGTMAWSAVTRPAVDYYGWKGGMLLLAAMCAHVFISALLTPKNDVICEQNAEICTDSTDGRIAQAKRDKIVDSTCKKFTKLLKGKPDIVSCMTCGCKITEHNLHSESHKKEACDIYQKNIPMNLTLCIQNSKQVPHCCVCDGHFDMNCYVEVVERSVGNYDYNVYSTNVLQNNILNESLNTKLAQEEKVMKSEGIVVDGDNYSNETVNDKSIKQYSKESKVSLLDGDSGSEYNNKTDTIYKQYANENKVLINKDQNSYDIRTPSRRKSFDFHILSNKSFLAFVAAMLFVNIGFSTNYMFLPVLMVSKGSSELFASRLIILVGAVGIPVRVVVGLIANHPKVDIIIFASAMFCSLGVLSLVTPLLCGHSSEGQVVANILFSVTVAGVYVIVPGALIEMLGLSNLNSALGVCSVTYGVGFLGGPPIAGWIYDMCGSYDYGFYFAGSSYLAGSILTAAIVFGKRFQNTK